MESLLHLKNNIDDVPSLSEWLGILLVRQLMDNVSYERTDGKNRLTLSLNL